MSGLVADVLIGRKIRPGAYSTIEITGPFDARSMKSQAKTTREHLARTPTVMDRPVLRNSSAD
jgi:hypothetical protein